MPAALDMTFDALAAKPGWSYHHHGHTPSHATALLMERVGFVVQDRHA